MADRAASVHRAYVADTRQQLSSLKKTCVNLEKQTQLSLKFVDWFTDTTLRAS